MTNGKANWFQREWNENKVFRRGVKLFTFLIILTAVTDYPTMQSLLIQSGIYPILDIVTSVTILLLFWTGTFWGANKLARWVNRLRKERKKKREKKKSGSSRRKGNKKKLNKTND